jgi:hypothetical protein
MSDSQATPERDIPTQHAWRDFCLELAKAGDVLLRPDIPATAINRSEGLRYLSRLLRIGLIQNLEAADPDFPVFYRPSDEITKFGGDSPDNVYWSAMVRGTNDYVIRGTRGGAFYFSIGAKIFRAHLDQTVVSTGELTDKTLQCDAKGAFEIIASSKPQPGNWLRMEADTNFLLIRQTRLDHKSEVPGTFHIERIGGDTTPAPLAGEVVRAALMRTAGFVIGNSQKFADWLPVFQKNTNQMEDVGQEWFWKQGGDSLLSYLWGYFKLRPNQAWVLDFTPPPGPYWSFSLYNVWAESLDYRYRPVTVNKHSAKLNADGSVTMVVSPARLDFGNWLDTAGHLEGMALYRGMEIEAVPQVTCRVIDAR